ncbi:O-antigen ligase family protein [Pseudoalteromonas shioyasakiensis]|uniref:O-antigen ligase family protein n=1 Tax=Pseudoalteromonas shioyasakiensis TaxID=1190813 RepID=UPI002118CEE4|nr:O-antigen ligase family protein [Pseudoalteromonas shioyasakiensis]MCQ8876509.1 O-antigen ligase family protein [Pseudoalteromonas shioyasakiensis]
MAYITSVIMIITFYYALKKAPYVRSSKLFLCFYSLFFVRVIFSVNHEITFQPVFAGQSLTSLSSLVTIFIVFVLINKKYLTYRAIVPYYIVMVLAVLSTVYSSEWVGGVVVLMKWSLLVVTSIAIIQLFYQFGLVNTLRPFYYLFMALLISQAFSILLGQGKDTESLNSTSNAISYIAGYAHESAFSILMYNGFLISAILMIKKSVKPFIPFLFLLGLIFANYRTLLISAMIPLICTYLAYFYFGAKKDTKVTVFTLAIIFIGIVSTLFGESIINRFGELGGAFVNVGELMTIDYSLFSVEEKRLLSSRIYLWNMYLAEFSGFSFFEQVFGAGPEAWANYFEVYAHNTFVAVLFDLGYIGLIALIIAFYCTFRMILKSNEGKLKLTMMSFLIGFFIMSNSTMPLWAVEGVHLFSFIFTVAFYLSKKN